MAEESFKTFGKFSLDTSVRIAALPVDAVRVFTAAFAAERSRYSYTGSGKLLLTDEDREQILKPVQSNYKRLTVNPEKRMHWERVHGRKKDGKLEDGKKTAPFAPGAAQCRQLKAESLVSIAQGNAEP